MRIGPIHLSSPFCQAGLAGYSDRAMRLVARRRGCGYAVTEALLDITLCNGGEGLRKSIDINDEDHPIAGQIIGSAPDAMSQAAAILAGAGYDVIDLNFACPVKKIKNKARGGHMLLDVPRALAVMRAVRDRLPDRPLTVSLRRAFDDSPQAEDRFFEIIETVWSLGFVAARVHARTVEQKYIGSARWPFLAEAEAAIPGENHLRQRRRVHRRRRRANVSPDRRRYGLDRPRGHRKSLDFPEFSPAAARPRSRDSSADSSTAAGCAD